MSIEPFGYFKADACGWTDCHDDDEGAIPLWDNDALLAIEKQRDDLLAAAEVIEINSDECMDFDECMAMLIQIDDYHNLMEAIAKVKGGA